jgi:hypothetical protein
VVYEGSREDKPAAEAMNGNELRARLDRLGRPDTELTPLLGLSNTGLCKQMRGERAVSRQTELLLDHLEKVASKPPAKRKPRSQHREA